MPTNNEKPMHPGTLVDLLRIEVVPYGRKKLADALGISLNRCKDFLDGDAGLTKTMAKKLQMIFGIQASTWLSMQKAYDEVR